MLIVSIVLITRTILEIGPGFISDMIEITDKPSLMPDSEIEKV
jgi:hypothetical protein